MGRDESSSPKENEMMTVQKPASSTLIAHRNPHTKKFQISTFGNEIVKVVPEDFKDINEVRAWVNGKGGTMGERKFHPFIGGYCEISLPQ
jgi:hypothetical protein